MNRNARILFVCFVVLAFVAGTLATAQVPAPKVVPQYVVFSSNYDDAERAAHARARTIAVSEEQIDHVILMLQIAIDSNTRLAEFYYWSLAMFARTTPEENWRRILTNAEHATRCVNVATLLLDDWRRMKSQVRLTTQGPAIRPWNDPTSEEKPLPIFDSQPAEIRLNSPGPKKSP